MWSFITAILFTGYIFLAYFLTKNKKTSGIAGSLLLLVLTFIFLLVLRLPELTRYQLNADEGQWIACANTFFNDPVFWYEHFHLKAFTRELTILPLSLVYLFVSKISYLELSVFAIFLWSVFLIYFFKSILLLFDLKTAFFSYSIMLLTIGLFSAPDFVAYNSEIPATVGIVIIFYAFIRYMVSANHFSLFMSGLLLPVLALTKSQTIPFIACSWLVMAGWLLYERRNQAFLRFVYGNVSGVLVIFLPFLLFGTAHEGISYLAGFLSGYSSGGLPVGGKYTGSRKVLEMLKSVFSSQLIINFVIVPGSLLTLLSVFRNSRYYSSRQIFLFASSILLFCAAVFCVYFPAHLFTHYSLLYVFPAALLAACFIHSLNIEILKTGKHHMLACSVFLVILFIVRSTDKNPSLLHLNENCSPHYRNVLTESIIHETQRGDRMVIWGWNTSYYVETNLQMGSDIFYPLEILLNWPSKNKMEEEYLSELKLLKPEVFLELIGPDQFIFTDTAHQSLKHFPEIYNYVEDNYNLISQKGNEKFYLLKE